MSKGTDKTLPVKCTKCGLTVQVPVGGRRLCGDRPAPADEPELVEPLPEPGPGGNFPRIESDLAAIERLNDGYRRITREMGKAIVGQQRVLEELLIAIFARAHCLLVGVPGLAKTLMIRTLADC